MIFKAIRSSALITLLALGGNVFAVTTPHTNIEIAREFLESIVNKKDSASALKYVGEYYIEHDPQGSDGPEGLKGYIDWLRTNYPEAQITIKKTLSDGNYVMFHVHSVLTPNSKGQAIVDIFRLDNGKVVEHWDVTQEIPEVVANPNGMF